MSTSPHEAANYSIELEVEVPGTPEQVWDAISTGPGIAAWFVPADVEPKQGGTVSFDMGNGMDGAGVVTGWEPPHRLVYEEIWAPADEASSSKLATEFLVEARSGDTCVVRLVTNVFGSTADWGDELGAMREGWTVFLGNLQRYLTDFPGQESSTVMATGQVTGSLDEGWAAFAAALGIDAPLANVGERVASSGPAVPAFAGTVELVVDGDHHRGVVLRTDAPAPGFAVAFAYSWRGQVHVYFHGYFFDADAAAVAQREQPQWNAWMAEHFPMADADALMG